MWKEAARLNRKIEKERSKARRLKEAMGIAVNKKYILIYEKRKEVNEDGR